MYTTQSKNAERPCMDKYDRFELWLRENGAQFEMVSLCYSFVHIELRPVECYHSFLLSFTLSWNLPPF